MATVGSLPIPPVGKFFQEYPCELWKRKYINVDFFIKHFTVKIIQVQKKRKRKKMIVEGILNYFLYYFFCNLIVGRGILYIWFSLFWHSPFWIFINPPVNYDFDYNKKAAPTLLTLCDNAHYWTKIVIKEEKHWHESFISLSLATSHRQSVSGMNKCMCSSSHILY